MTDFIVRIEITTDDDIRKIGTVVIDQDTIDRMAENGATIVSAVTDVASAAIHRMVEDILEEKDNRLMLQGELF